MSLISITELRHLQRNDAWLDAVEGWQASHGADRAYWRSLLRWEIAAERRRIADYTAWLKANAPTTTLKDAA